MYTQFTSQNMYNMYNKVQLIRKVPMKAYIFTLQQ